MKNAIELQIHIDAEPHLVWRTLTEPNLVSQYMFGAMVKSNWDLNSSIEYYTRTENGNKTLVEGIVLAYEPNKKLKHTLFPSLANYPNTQENHLEVTYLLQNIGGSTELKIIQEGYKTVTEGAKRYIDTLKGWDHALPLLKKTAESIDI